MQTYLIPFDKLFAILKCFGHINRSKWYVCASRHRIGGCVAWALLWIWCGRRWRRWWCLGWCLMLRWLLLGFACKCWCCHFYACFPLSLHFLRTILLYQIPPLLHALIISRISEWLVEYAQTTLPLTMVSEIVNECTVISCGYFQNPCCYRRRRRSFVYFLCIFFFFLNKNVTFFLSSLSTEWQFFFH